VIALNGKWDLRDQSGEYAAEITFPGDGVSALHSAGLILDPYWGRNEYNLRWIAEREWIASRAVTLPDDAQVLVLSGLDTIVDVTVNGKVVLRAENAFRTYRVDLAGVAKAGENRVELRFRSNVAEAAARQKTQPFYVPYNTDNCPIPNGNMLRKAQFDFGWDWNIALAPFGVLGDMWIEPARLARLADIHVTQAHAKSKARVTITARLTGDAEGAPVLFQLGGRTAEANVTGRMARTTFTIKDPELWWPAGQGMQPLYDLTVRYAEQTEQRRIGLRRIELITEEDAKGTGFKFRVNGRDIFAKGANWIPADALSGRITEDKVRDLLQSAVDANMNMIRVWGGGRYEADWFYDFCDELGLMVWQDFMFACHEYPATDAFLAEVAAEVRENVARLHHHASIALWCGDNELIGALGWFPETRANRDRYLVAYDRLNRTVESNLKSVLPEANWWPSSPSPGYMSFGDGWHNDSSGDMHFWSVWHENKNFDHYRDVSPRFCSEFGFQSYPSMDVIRTFAGPEDMNIAAPVLESHQKNAGGNERIAATMFRYFRFPVDFENFVYLSQVQQGLAIKTAVGHWRGLKPHCMGTLYWQLNDTWPVASWSSLDYGGGWKLMHHMARQFFQPLLVTAVPDGDKINLRAISDLADKVDVTLEAFAVSPDGATRPLKKAKAKVKDATKDLLKVKLSDLDPQEMLAFVWSGSDGTRSGDVYAPRPYKTYDLLPPKIGQSLRKRGDHWDVTLSAQALAHFVSLEADQPGRFSQNAFALFPGHDAKITFTPQTAGKKPKFTIRDLHSATYGVMK